MFEGMIVLGENLNATRRVKANGIKVKDMGDGKTGYPYKNKDGEDRFLDLTEAIQAEAVQASGMVGHISTGIKNRDEEFVASMAHEQIARGADYLDLCVDEISPWQEERIGHMKWIVQTIQKHVRLPLSIDSSDPDTIREGLGVYDWEVGKPILNSVNLEESRIPTLDLAKETGAQLLANASGETALPTSVEERVANMTKLMQMMDEREIPMEERTLDMLLLPIGTNPEHGNHFLDSCRAMRDKFGDAFHLTGGLSNVGFGLPKRRLINEAITWLAKEAGCDMAFIDPLQIKGFEPEDEGFKKAVDVLLGKDPFCAQYIMFIRSQK